MWLNQGGCEPFLHDHINLKKNPSYVRTKGGVGWCNTRCRDLPQSACQKSYFRSNEIQQSICGFCSGLIYRPAMRVAGYII